MFVHDLSRSSTVEEFFASRERGTRGVCRFVQPAIADGFPAKFNIGLNQPFGWSI